MRRAPRGAWRPRAPRILCVDSSPGMIARAARKRMSRAGVGGRVDFRVRRHPLVRTRRCGPLDAVATLFFLDCFTAEEAELDRGARVGASLGPGALWLFADFVMPEGGLCAPARAGVARRALRLLQVGDGPCCVSRLPPLGGDPVACGLGAASVRGPPAGPPQERGIPAGSRHSVGATAARAASAGPARREHLGWIRCAARTCPRTR